MADQGALKQIIQKLKDSNNVLVTVNSNPSVDELSAALAITLCINKLNKHATAVFSGNVPPAIEFLNPEKTFENTRSEEDRKSTRLISITSYRPTRPL